MRFHKHFFLAALLIATCSRLVAQDDLKHQQIMEKLVSANTEQARFYALAPAAKSCFVVSQFKEAQSLSSELLRLAPKYQKDWNYGNAIHTGNMVLGQLALLDDKVNDAKEYLLKAGKTPGSPQLDSFGPNMSLAKGLLERGEYAVVLEYFALCSKFWGYHQDRLDMWSGVVKNGEIPDFKANLYY